MKRNLPTLAVPAAIAAGLLMGCSTSLRITDRTDAARPSDVQVKEGFDTFGRKWEVLTRSDSKLLTYTGTITDLDYANRVMTLQDADGRLETFGVDKKVQRFGEARIGDKVTMDYYLAYDAEVRPPTNEEKANPLVVLDTATTRAGTDAAPAGYDARRVRAVVTIVSMDKAAQTVTVKGPRGQYYTARVVDADRLNKVRIGDSIVMTFTEATGVSLKHEVMTRTDATLLTYTGTITDLDYANRVVTLQNAEGRLETFGVDKKVQRFGEARVGDKVTLDYFLGYSAEVRKPTEEEQQNPLVVLDSATGRAGADSAPAGYDARRVRAVVTIVYMDKTAKTITVKGPLGRYYTARVADPSRFNRVRLGDTILMTFTEATAIVLKPDVETRSEATLLTYTGTITDLDYANRVMTLQNAEGRLETFGVDKKVQRFGEARIGDKVTMDYYLGYSAEVRPPTAEEKANPLVVLDSATGRAGADSAPAGYDARRVRAVVTIESMDKAAKTITVKGPRGRYYTARVADSSRFERVRLGDTILMTFTEAVGVSLKPDVEARTEFVLLNYTGTITDIDYPGRSMTLKNTEGRYDTFYVAKAVQRFNEAKVGDKVSMDYFLGVSAEVRKPTAEEQQNPLTVLDTDGKAGPASAPAAYDVRRIRAVVTIESMNKAAKTITVKGPRGKYFTTRVADPSRFERVRIGDTIVMTFLETTAVSLKPAAN